MSIKSKDLPAPDDFVNSIAGQLDDMQGLICRGYKNLPYAEFIILEIKENADGAGDDDARRYFIKVLNNFVTNSQISLQADTIACSSDNDDDELTQDDEDEMEDYADNNFNKRKAVQIAFTSSGLSKLGLPEEIRQTFSREFLEGMNYSYADPSSPGNTIRERGFLLGDGSDQNWNWGKAQQSNQKTTHRSVDCILLLYAETEKLLADLRKECFEDLNKGVNLVEILPTYPFDVKKGAREHFGFRDGISQPKMRGFNKARDHHYDENKHNGNLLNPGEFVLGYLNEYGSYSPSPYFEAVDDDKNIDPLPGHPGKRDLGKNGSYLVFRQMEQHVESFYKYVFENSRESGKDKFEKAITLAAKMIGRWPNGQSLAENQNYLGEETKDLDNFLYYHQDHYGIGCPFGAHVRRTNPRDQVQADRSPSISLELSNKHRMLRRGRTYGAPLEKSGEAVAILECAQKKSFEGPWESSDALSIKPVRGIHFLCLVSDIARQFEFVQNVWVNSNAFAELGAETDPITFPRSAVTGNEHHEFSTPQEIIRNRYKNLPEFTTVIGGAYFFMPGLKALRFILKQPSRTW